ncbi:hypothetical protein F5Y04DRAFT_95136 [Hypomontagnella monticulosa]|nr:hypothetical protein F5Y04DRAFT_95136 [Hypomontagnella monticulosa]
MSLLTFHGTLQNVSLYTFSVILGAFLLGYIFLVRRFRYRRMEEMNHPYRTAKRPLSSMTADEAHTLMTQLQELEFPSAFTKARTISLLKAGGIPTMSKLFAVTGQNNRKNSGKRMIDTEVLLREAQTRHPTSERYMRAVARMNYLHSRYRKAGKILDEDMLHTLGSGIVEIFRVVDTDEWRTLTDAEKCAVGIFHRNLGEDMGIPFTPLPSCERGWRDGLHFARELYEWTGGYEKRVAKPCSSNDAYVRVYVDSATKSLPKAVTTLTRKLVASELDDTMRISLCLESPGHILLWTTATIRWLRKMVLRYLCLPRPAAFAIKAVEDQPNPVTGLYNFQQLSVRPWYVRPTFWNRWSLSALILRVFGGKVPSTSGVKYHPEGYNLLTIGPERNAGKGLDDMGATIRYLQARGVVECPFKHKSY